MRDQIDRSFSETFPLAWTERYNRAHADFVWVTQAPKGAPRGLVLVRMRDQREGGRYSPYFYAGSPDQRMAWAIRNFDPFQG